MRCFSCVLFVASIVGCATTEPPGASSTSDAGATWLEAGPETDATAAEACASRNVIVDSNPSPRPIDIVWVIDSSESMRDEAARVQESMNRFVERFGSSDVQTILITDKATVDVPPPLGSDALRFMQIDEEVASNSALLMAPARWDDYQHRIRPLSVVHVITLTDDESLISAECLLIRMEEKLGPDHDFRLHTISSEAIGVAAPEADDVRRGGDRSTECKLAFRWQDTDFMACAGADHAGREYWRAAAATGGVATSVCAADWSAVFDQIGEAVLRESAFGCEIELPEVPAGATFDPSEVKLIAARDGREVELARAEDAIGCGDAKEAWYLQTSSTPAKAVLCPLTCNAFASAGTALSLDMGCAWRIR